MAAALMASTGSRGRSSEDQAWLSLFVDDGRTFPIPRTTCQRSHTVPPSYGHVGLLASGVVNDEPARCTLVAKRVPGILFRAVPRLWRSRRLGECQSG